LLFILVACTMVGTDAGAVADDNPETTLPPPRALLGPPLASDCPAGAAEKTASNGSGSTKAKTPAPRTVCQALHAYCHCLYLRCLGIEPAAQKEENGDKEKKAAPANGDKNGNADKNDKDAAGDKKNSQAKESDAAPGTRGKTGETERDKEQDKEEKK